MSPSELQEETCKTHLRNYLIENAYVLDDHDDDDDVYYVG